MVNHIEYIHIYECVNIQYLQNNNFVKNMKYNSKLNYIYKKKINGVNIVFLKIWKYIIMYKVF